jgi:putative hydrolase of HD superfamily
MNTKNIVNFIFEINQLKRIRHIGFKHAGVADPDSVADHVMRAAQIGYILAAMEGDANPEKVATMVLIHDNGEARIGDQDKLSARYFNTQQAEHNAICEQLGNTLPNIRRTWLKYYDEFEKRDTKEGIIAKDADWLEQAFQAKEYVDLGYQAASDWIENVSAAIETDSAKKLLREMKNTKFTDWWRGLKKMTYNKLNSVK